MSTSVDGPRRVYGLETEYALVYHPSVFDRRPLDARRIYGVIEDLLRERCRTLPADGHKGGLFLENGALVSFEAQTLRHGLLEISTPECSSARQAVAWQSALDRTLIDLLPALHGRLRTEGCHGRVVIGKNSTDHRDNYYGTHENYSLDLPWMGSRAGLIAGLLAFEVVSLLLELPLYLLVLAAAVVALVVLGPPLLLLALLRRWYRRGTFGSGGSLGKDVHTLTDEGVRLWCLLRKRAGRPLSRLYSCFLESTLLAPLAASLSAYFVTRVVWCGSGAIVDGKGDDVVAFSLMQRGRDAWELARSQGVRCLLDLKAGGPEALWALRPRKRLHVTYSDSNLSEGCLFLKLGVTGLLLEMLEAGHRFEDLQVASLPEALEQVCRDPDLRCRVRLRDGRQMSAVEIQRCYWQQARSFYCERARPEVTEVLEAWGSVLDGLERDPSRLADRVDWIAKRALMSPLTRSSGQLMELPGLLEWALLVVPSMRRHGAPWWAEPERLRSTLPEASRERLQHYVEYHELTWPQFARLCHEALQLRKIDLKYHELSDEGYAVRLAQAGRLARVADPAEMELARDNPPPDTRAAVRAGFIRSALAPGGRMGWGTFHDAGRRVRFTFSDPLECRLSDDKGAAGP